MIVTNMQLACAVDKWRKEVSGVIRKMEGEKENSKERRGEAGQIKRQKDSKVWDYFKLKQNENAAQCVYCKIELAFARLISRILDY